MMTIDSKHVPSDKSCFSVFFFQGIVNIIRPDGSCSRVPSGQWVSNCIPGTLH